MAILLKTIIIWKYDVVKGHKSVVKSLKMSRLPANYLHFYSKLKI